LFEDVVCKMIMKLDETWIYGTFGIDGYAILEAWWSRCMAIIDGDDASTIDVDRSVLVHDSP